MIAITLNKEIPCEYICKMVNDYLMKEFGENGITHNKILTINIKDAIESTTIDNKPIAYIEQK